MNEHRTITLTGRPPVRIVEADWPLIATAEDWDNQYKFQANRTWTLRVRQHADGRAIVYGVYTTQFQGASGCAGGKLLDAGADVAQAIIAVADTLGFKRELADQCISDLPAQEI